MNINRITRNFYKLKTHLYGYKAVGKNSVVFAPLQVDNPSSISIGNNVFISQGAWLMGNANHKRSLNVGNDVTIGHYAHIVANYNVLIEDNVLIADKVFITDCSHEYKDISTPVQKQGIIELGDVIIGDGSWIGENVCVLGASIGKHCIVGANAVVTRSIPDYSIAVGNPAVIVKRFDTNKKEWVKQ